MQIYIKTQNGKTLDLQVEQNDTTLALKQKIQEIGGIPIDQQRILFAGKQFENDRTLCDYGVTPESTLYLILRLVGMISTFTSSDTSNPLIKFLMDPEGNKDLKLIEALQQKAKNESANSFSTYRYAASTDSWFDPGVREIMSKFLDFMWDLKAPVGAVDMRLVIPDAEFQHLAVAAFTYLASSSSSSSSSSSFQQRGAGGQYGGGNGGNRGGRGGGNGGRGPANPSNASSSSSSSSDLPASSPDVLSKNLLTSLKRKFTELPGAGRDMKIAMRITRGPTKACINFHCDGVYASVTVQIALNDESEYKGGKLCFFANDRLDLLARPAGSMTQHPAKVLHAVTSLTEGTRKSLFVVDEKNGLGEGAVVMVNEKEVKAFVGMLKSTMIKG